MENLQFLMILALLPFFFIISCFLLLSSGKGRKSFPYFSGLLYSFLCCFSVVSHFFAFVLLFCWCSVVLCFTSNKYYHDILETKYIFRIFPWGMPPRPPLLLSPTLLGKPPLLNSLQWVGLSEILLGHSQQALIVTVIIKHKIGNQTNDWNFSFQEGVLQKPLWTSRTSDKR